MDAVNKGSEAEPVRIQIPGQASAQLLSADGGEAADGRGQLSWALFEWARNPYVILITIYIFSPCFTSTVAGDPVRGQTIWGNIIILCFTLWAFMLPGAAGWSFVLEVPLFGIDAGAHENSRISGLIVAVWLLVFSLPLLLWTPDVKGERVPVGKAIRRGFGSVVGTVRKLRHYRNIAIYLAARMFYMTARRPCSSRSAARRLAYSSPFR
ncbi:MAG: MFS transporter [Parvibaculum sp.]|nr:MFS transporter [Parvibaculum sp.]